MRFVLAALVLTVSGSAARAAERPNILWISCEDISPNLGCYGDPHASTPNLDKLASQGARFTRAFTHAPVCAIVRSGIITGCLLYTSPSPRDRTRSRMPSSA